MNRRGLETNRCRLLPLGAGDRALVVALRTDPRVREFLGGPLEPAAAEAAFDRMVADDPDSHFAIRSREGGEPIGVASIGPWHDGAHRELSYELAPASWGKGYAREALSRLLAHARDVMGLRTIVAETQERNAQSRKLLERLGFEPWRELERFGERQIVYRMEFAKPEASGRPSRVAREVRTVRFMIRAHCRAKHGAAKTGAAAGLCTDCVALTAYAEARLAACRYGERKPACGACPTRCYRSDMRERIRLVMRWAGPRMLWLAPFEFIRHLQDGLPRAPRGAIAKGRGI